MDLYRKSREMALNYLQYGACIFRFYTNNPTLKWKYKKIYKKLFFYLIKNRKQLKIVQYLSLWLTSIFEVADGKRKPIQ